MKFVNKIVLFLACAGTLKAQINVKGRIDHIVPDGSDTLGNIYLTVSGGTSPYTYTWNPGATTAKDLTNATANTYTVKVRGSGTDSIYYKYKLGYKTYWTNFSSCFFRRDTIFGQTTAPNYPYTGWNTTYSKNTLKSTEDGWAQWVVASTSNQIITGFCDSISVAGTGIYTDLDLGIYQSSGNLYYMFNGSYSLIGTCAAGDVLRIERTGTTVNFLKNSSSIYSFTLSGTIHDWKLQQVVQGANQNANIGASFKDTSSINFPNYVQDIPNIIHCAPGASNGSIKLTPRISGTTHNYTWSPSGATTSSITGLSVGTYSVIIKDSDSNLSNYNYNIGYKTYWTNFYGTKFKNDSLLFQPPYAQSGWNSAISKNTLRPSTNGWVEIVSKSLNDIYMFGFLDSLSSISGVYQDLDYGVYLLNNKIYRIWGGAYTLLSSYRAGDVIRIERIGSNFIIKVNGISINSISCTTNKDWKIKAILNTGYVWNMGCSFTDSTNTNFPNYIQNSPVIYHSSGLYINDGSVKLNTVAGRSYTWSPNGENDKIITNKASGTYTVTVKDTLNNTSSYKYQIGYKVRYTNHVGTYVRNDTLFTQSPPSSGFCTALSKNILRANKNGSISWVVKDVSEYNVIGFLDSAFSANGIFTDIDLGIKQYYYTLYYYTGGSTGFIGYVDPGDILKIQRSGSTVTLYRNDAALYSFTSIPTNKDWKVKSVVAYGGKLCNLSCTFPTNLNAVIDKQHADYESGVNGSISVFPYGGVSPYTYLWNDGDVLSSKANLVPGTYTIVVSDSAQRDKIGKVINIGVKPNWTIRKNIRITSDSTYMINTDSLGRLISQNYIKKNDAGWQEVTITKLNQDVAFGLIGLPSSYVDTTYTPPVYADTAMNRKSDLAYSLMRKATKDSLVYGGGSNLLQLSADYDFIHLARIKNGQFRPLSRNTPSTTVFSYGVGDILKVGRDANGKVYFARNDTTLYTVSSSSSSQYMYSTIVAKTAPALGKGGVSVGPNVGPPIPFTACSIDLSKNWTSTREFDEYGNVVNETREYFDNLGRPTQTQTKLFLENNIIATEAIYDSHGRSIGQTLPAPLFVTSNCFAPTFFSNPSNTHYGLDNFDKPVTTSSLTGELNNPSSVGNSLQGTLGWYYSNNNSVNAYVPSDGYPYNRSEYYSDPLNRFYRSGGVGANHKFGMNHTKSAAYSDGSADLTCVFPAGTYELDENFATKTYSVNASPPLIIRPTTLAGVHKTTTCNEDGRCQANYTTESGKLLATCVNGTDWTVYYYDVKGRLKAIVSPEDFICGATYHRVTKQDTTSRAFSCDTTINLISRNITNPVPGTPEVAHWVSMEVVPNVNFFDTLLSYTSSYDFRFKSDTIVPKDTLFASSYSYDNILPDTIVIADTTIKPYGFHTDSLFHPFADKLKEDVLGRLSGKKINYTGKYVFGVTYASGTTTYQYDEPQDFDFEIAFSDSGNTRVVNRVPGGVTKMFFSDSILGGATNVVLKCVDLKIQLKGFDDVPVKPFSPCDTDIYVSSWEAELLANINANTSLIARTIIGTSPSPTYSPSYSRRYFYNEYDHLSWSENVNEGRTDYLYDLKEDKLLFSQNDKQQANNNEFNYLKYDDLGRLTESGVFDPTIADGSASTNYVFQTYADWKAAVSVGAGNTSAAALASTNTMFIDFSGTRSTEEKYIEYDLADGSMPLTSSGYSQKYTGGSVSKTSNANSTTWYSYDEMGRVSFVILDFVGLGSKSLEYTYDMRGKLKSSVYQKNTSSEYFRHMYYYDQNERMRTSYYSQSATSPYSTAVSRYYYYLHGPVARREIGVNLQGLDYSYTINGLLKAVNNPRAGSDPGNDGGGNGFAADLFSFALDYYPKDYERNYSLLNSNKMTGAYSNTNVSYTGIANAIRWRNVYPSSAPAPDPTTVSAPFMYEFDYDSFYRLKGATFGNFTATSGTGGLLNDIAFTTTKSFSLSGITYDKNGNILTLKRNEATASGVLMDDLTYNYNSLTRNKLNSVTDAVTTSLGLTADIDLPNQTNSVNYSYNAIGQLTLNIQDDQKYYYNASGLTTKITRNSNSNTIAEFTYNDKNLRHCKTSYNSSGVAILKTYYVYDQSGSLVATYEDNISSGGPPAPVIKELVIREGSTRTGIYDIGTTKPYYELTDHLGNVREVFTDISGVATPVSYTDYYPHGSVMPGRNFSSTPSYRYNYQGQEKDGETGLVNFELRQMDPRLGRWFNPDPYGQYHSPYLSMGNNPMNSVDPDGGWTGSSNPYTTWAFGSEVNNKFWDDAGPANTTNYGPPTEGQAYAWNEANAEWVLASEWKQKNGDGTSRTVGYTYERKEAYNQRYKGYFNSLDQLKSASSLNKNLSDIDKSNSWLGLFIEGSNTAFGLRTVLNKGQNVVNAGYYEAIIGGSKYYIKQGSKTFRNYNIGKTKLANLEAQYVADAAKGAKIAKGLKVGGQTLGFLGLMYAGWNLLENPNDPKAKADLGFSAAGFIPFAGWAVSGTYFLADFFFPEQTRMTAESINEGMNARREYTKNPMNAVVCFKAGTKILKNSGLVSIEDVLIGDSVLSYNEETRTIQLSKVKNVVKRTTSNYLVIKTTSQEICVTSEHPFFIIGKGWIKAKDLIKGESLKTIDDKMELVLNIKENLIVTEVYNIEVERNSNYFVSPSKILVHNKKIVVKDEEKGK